MYMYVLVYTTNITHVYIYMYMYMFRNVQIPESLKLHITLDSELKAHSTVIITSK